MRTYAIHSDPGKFVEAFEIDNVFVSRKSLLSIICSAQGVTQVTPRERWTGPPEEHASFVYLGEPYIVWEPFGDNSRYWIGPRVGVGGSRAVDALPLKSEFDRHRPSLVRQILGTALSLGSNLRQLNRESGDAGGHGRG